MADQLFDDSAAIRRVTREGVLIAGGGRALLLQVAHPAIAQGVADHSDFGADPVSRLQGTLGYLLGVIFGTRSDARQVSLIVRHVHERVVGPGYRADDPELQVWVNATLFDTSLLLYERVFGPLSTAQAEQFCRQFAVVATSLGCPDRLWPADLREFRSYWDGMIGSLRVGPTAKQVAHGVLHPRLKAVPPPLWPALPVHRFVTAGLLPEPIRRQYGLAWDPRRQLALDLALKATGQLYPRIPVLIRATLPTRYNLYQLRRQLARARREP